MSKEFNDSNIDTQAAGVDFIAFSGGGAKGNIYSGVYKGLKEGGIIDGVKGVAGSSAGAITAAFVATGINISDFDNISKTTNLGKLVGKDESIYYPGKITLNALALAGGVVLKATGNMHIKDGIPINTSAKPLYELMQKTIRDNVAAFLIDQETLNTKDPKKLSDEDLAKAKQSRIDELCIGKDETFKQKLTELQERAFSNDGKILFKDLTILKELDHTKFKDLIVTATNNKTLDLKIFSPEKTPDAEIALACKASASIPLAFTKTKIDGEKYVDGGYRDNIPIKYFNKGNENQQQDDDIAQNITGDKEAFKNAKKEGKTLAFAFGATDDMENPINTAIYSSKEKIQEPGMLVRFFENVVMKVVNFFKGRELEGMGKMKYSEAEENMYQGIREKASLNTVVLDTKKVGTLGFTDAMNNADYLATKGYIQTMNHIDNHEMGKVDPNLRDKEFMLSVYEKMHFDRSTARGFVDKLIGQKETKLENVLYFCKKDGWVGVDGANRDNKEVIKDFITILSEKEEQKIQKKA